MISRLHSEKDSVSSTSQPRPLYKKTSGAQKACLPPLGWCREEASRPKDDQEEVLHISQAVPEAERYSVTGADVLRSCTEKS